MNAAYHNRALLALSGEPVIVGGHAVLGLYTRNPAVGLGMDGYGPTLELDALPAGVGYGSPVQAQNIDYTVGAVSDDGTGWITLRLTEV